MRYTLCAITYKLERKIHVFLDRRCDRRFGVDTCGVLSAEDLDLSLADKSEAFCYEPTPVLVLRSMLKALPIDHSMCTSVDFGSGKGRVLLLASEYAYKQIIGVEFSRCLHTFATKNLTIWNDPKRRCFNIKSVCVDARDDELPLDPLVLFFFTPFKPSVGCQVIRRILESLAKHPRSVQVLYYGGRQDFIKVLMRLNFAHREIYSRGRRKGLLCESQVSLPEENVPVLATGCPIA